MIRVLRHVARWQVFASEAQNGFRQQEGQTMAEYGVVLAVVTLIVVLALTTLATNIQGAIDSVAGIFPGN
jgi:Flp pilus assembly pilin Flp